MTTATQFAMQFARHVSKKWDVPMYGEDVGNGRTSRYGIRVRNKSESNEHGFCHNALATICYEGLGDDMIYETQSITWINRAKAHGFYLEPYSSWLIAIYAI